MEAHLRIGIVEDNDDLRESLAEVLGRLGHAVRAFSSAEDLADAPRIEPFQLLLLDLNLPGEDGLSLAQRLKRVQPGLRVIMLTTRTALADRVRGYDIGADLYLPKPVAEEELVAAVRSLARQIHSGSLQAVEGTDPALQLDPQALHLRGPNGVALLSSTEVTLLAALACAPGMRMEYWQLIETMGLEVDDASKASLAVKMTRLRGKLGQVGCPSTALRSLRASGYQLCVPLEIR